LHTAVHSHYRSQKDSSDVNVVPTMYATKVRKGKNINGFVRFGQERNPACPSFAVRYIFARFSGNVANPYSKSY